MNITTPEELVDRNELKERNSVGDQVTSDCGIIEVHIRELNQLFDSLDPSPFREKDLDAKAEEYIVESVKELSSQNPSALVVYLGSPAGLADEAHIVGDAIRIHFARKSQFTQRELSQLIRRGWISLVIGFTFLAVCFGIGQLIGQLMGQSYLAVLLNESLMIGGWVGMWRPLEIFLYDWWPIIGMRNIYDRLSRIRVRLVYKEAA